VQSKDRTLSILLDPYRSGALGGRISHAPIQRTPDIVAITHYHEDHGWHGGLAGEPIIVDRPQTTNGIQFKMVTLPHDCHGGSMMGMSRMISFAVDGVNVLHPGDLGRLPTAAELKSLGPVDVLLLPVGGTYTIGSKEAIALTQSIRPTWVIPMHYRSDRVNLDMDSRQTFVDAAESKYPIQRNCGSSLHCSPDEITQESTIVLLEPAL